MKIIINNNNETPIPLKRTLPAGIAIIATVKGGYSHTILGGI